MKLIPISGRQMCKLVEKLGFQKVHHVGSHARYIHSDGRKITIAIHNKPIAPGTLNSISKQAQMDKDTFLKLFKKHP